MSRERWPSRSLTPKLRAVRLRSVPLVVGALLVIVGISGLLDDSGVFSNPPWIALVIAVLALCVVMVGRTLRALRSGDSSRASVEG